ncbi:branched-chain amino acid ABC transporter permease [Microbacterium sp. NPDC058389]|uniref:branched-chain amino acid ABC transporter permease n=1 Tax=Microbacterium sp. NPDC058389 TaxID=3346475 RepID=UPI003663C5A4
MTRSVRYVAFAVLAAAAVVLPFVSSTYYVTIATLILASAILASSVNLLAGNAGLFSLGHAGIAGAAAYGLAWASRQGMDLPAQLGIALGLTLGVTAIYGLISMRTAGVYFLMVTLAAGMVCYGIAYRWSTVTGGVNGLTGVRRPEWISQDWQFYLFVLVVFLLITLSLRQLASSPFGLSLRGVRDSESRMRSLGYSNSALKFVAMLLSGLVAGLAGVTLVWQTEFISPTFSGFEASALALVMVVLGGAGRLFGPLVGAAIVVLIQQVLSTYVDRWQTVLGALFVVVVIVSQRKVIPRIREAIQRRRHTTTDQHELVHSSS